MKKVIARVKWFEKSFLGKYHRYEVILDCKVVKEHKNIVLVRFTVPGKRDEMDNYILKTDILEVIE